MWAAPAKGACRPGEARKNKSALALFLAESSAAAVTGEFDALGSMASALNKRHKIRRADLTTSQTLAAAQGANSFQRAILVFNLILRVANPASVIAVGQMLSLNPLVFTELNAQKTNTTPDLTRQELRPYLFKVGVLERCSTTADHEHGMELPECFNSRKMATRQVRAAIECAQRQWNFYNRKERQATGAP
ncbi:hypothetical protein [Janthinobacterium sp. LB2P70]|uniref:hypothetical protein n=1 Tax=Janthinobacterium sp. LB2P70 TaxID=3424197 RepID=UPI003F2622CB